MLKGKLKILCELMGIPSFWIMSILGYVFIITILLTFYDNANGKYYGEAAAILLAIRLLCSSIIYIICSLILFIIGIDKYESKSESIDVHTSKIIWLKFSLFGFGLIVPPISGIILLILVLLN